MPGIRMLIVEDDRRLAELVAARLRDLGHEVETAADGERGYELAATGRFDLALMDVMLPGRDGLSVIRDLRAKGSTMPVVVLTAKDAVPDRVDGLRAGADDYLVKPFAFEELLARIDAVARRSSLDQHLGYGPIELDIEAHRVTVAGEQVEFTTKEFALLQVLLEDAGKVVSRATLKERVWNFEPDAETKVVDLYVHYLRRKLGPAGDLIHTVRGIGYSLGR
ncbi:MAG: response regulator transcription factor [Actinomycetota bacterium]